MFTYGDGLYNALLELEDEFDRTRDEHDQIENAIASARRWRRVMSGALAALALILASMALVVRSVYFQSLLIELASASGFFVAVPLLLARRHAKRKTAGKLLSAALLLLIVGHFVTGVWQSLLLEGGVA